MQASHQTFSARDYYETLGVAHNTSAEDITNAYKRLSLRTHPDQFKTASQKEHAEAQFSHISEAYQVLSDPERRVSLSG